MAGCVMVGFGGPSLGVFVDKGESSSQANRGVRRKSEDVLWVECGSPATLGGSRPVA